VFAKSGPCPLLSHSPSRRRVVDTFFEQLSKVFSHVTLDLRPLYLTPDRVTPMDRLQVLSRMAHSCHTSAIRLAARIWGLLVYYDSSCPANHSGHISLPTARAFTGMCLHSSVPFTTPTFVVLHIPYHFLHVSRFLLSHLICFLTPSQRGKSGFTFGFYLLPSTLAPTTSYVRILLPLTL